MRRISLALLLAFGLVAPATAQVSVSIGINVPVYPQLVRVPGYPVYYAPGLGANFFFYDGMYWVYESDNWYTSAWYNGPWTLVDPFFVPVYLLRVPVRYYRDPPMHFRAWRADAPPRWDQHWGHDWERRRPGWDRWNRRAVPPPAPLPVYQRQYSGNRYPPVTQQRTLQSRNYRYQPRDAVVRQQFPQGAPQRSAAAPVPERRAAARAEMEERSSRPARPVEREPQHRAAPPERAAHQMPARPESSAARPVPRGPMPAPQERPGRGQGQQKDKDHDRGEGRGQDKKN
jgi:hypothetical protein